MAATALAEPHARFAGLPGARAAPAAAIAGEPAITAAWLLGRVPPGALPWPLLRPGRAGRGPGPDVREAHVRLPSGVPASGDVEVHRLATDFARHGHTRDSRYSALLLHLVWRDDRAPSEHGAPVRLAGGGLAPTVALEPLFGTAARLDAAIGRGPAGRGEPCTHTVASSAPEDVVALLRAEGHRRLAERTWRAQQLAAEVGWEAAWRTLLDRAMRASAGRLAERATRRVALADAITAAVAATSGGDLVRALSTRAREAAGAPSALLAPVRRAGLGAQRAREVGWNVMLPLAAALAAAYDDQDLGRDVLALVGRWPAPTPYGRTRALAALLGVAPADGLTAHGLLRLQELWCTRGGCGRCPLSPASPAGMPWAARGGTDAKDAPEGALLDVPRRPHAG